MTLNLICSSDRVTHVGILYVVVHVYAVPVTLFSCDLEVYMAFFPVLLWPCNLVHVALFSVNLAMFSGMYVSFLLQFPTVLHANSNSCPFCPCDFFLLPMKASDSPLLATFFHHVTVYLVFVSLTSFHNLCNPVVAFIIRRWHQTDETNNILTFSKILEVLLCL